jgi:hypothetical protein
MNARVTSPVGELWTNFRSADPNAAVVLLVAPAGLEGFFVELGEGLQAGRSGAEIRAALAGRYDSIPA